MKVQSLKDIPFEVILDCFLKAFENYFVALPSDPEYYRKRWYASGVDFNLSYGMFDGKTLVGFILHSIDKRQELQMAYNAGTGVIPTYRGKQVVQQIYHFAIADLRKNGIQKTILEVITENEKAIHVYRKVGFEVTRRYKCYKGEINPGIEESLELREVSLSDVKWEELPNQLFYSWDFQKESLLKGDYRFFEIKRNGEAESYFIWHEANQYLAQFDILQDNPGAWDRLANAVATKSIQIKINNVDTRLLDKVQFAERLGLQNHIDQFEMEMML